jgi:hypothetical protein
MLAVQLFVGLFYYVSEGVLIVPSLYFVGAFTFMSFFIVCVVLYALPSFNLLVDTNGIQTLEEKDDSRFSPFKLRMNVFRHSNRRIQWRHISTIDELPFTPFIIVRGKVEMKDGVWANSWDRKSILFPKLPYLKNSQKVLALLATITNANILVNKLEESITKS